MHVTCRERMNDVKAKRPIIGLSENVIVMPKHPQLMERAARRRLLFAPIGVVYHGAKSWGGHTTIDEGDNTRKGSSNSEHAADFRRRSRLHANDEGEE